MSGATEIGIFLISGIASVTDLSRGKIYNWLTFPAMALGCWFAFDHSGLRGCADSGFAMILALILYGWMFAIRWMSAGDVKLLMALGALGGSAFVLKVSVCAILMGGALAVLSLFARKKLGNFLDRMKTAVWVGERPAIHQQDQLPFGLALALASVWVLLWDPLPSWRLFG